MTTDKGGHKKTSDDLIPGECYWVKGLGGSLRNVESLDFRDLSGNSIERLLARV